MAVSNSTHPPNDVEVLEPGAKRTMLKAACRNFGFFIYIHVIDALYYSVVNVQSGFWDRLL